jgi:hypothetical protein
MSYVDEPDTNALLGDLSSPAWEIRRDAADTLGERREDHTVEYLKTSLRDPVGSVRSAAVQALGKIGGEGVLHPLLSCLSDGSDITPGPVLEALANMGYRSKEPIPHFIRYLRDHDKTTRAIANTSLMVLTGQSHRFRPTASPEDREKAVLKWEAWWEGNKDEFIVPGSKLE